VKVPPLVLLRCSLAAQPLVIRIAGRAIYLTLPEGLSPGSVMLTLTIGDARAEGYLAVR
jgi:hypothetical protein